MARSYNGTSDRVVFGSITAADNLAAFTAMALIRISSNVTTEQMLLTKGSETTGDYPLSMYNTDSSNQNRLTCYIRGTTQDGYVVSANNTVALNTWTVALATWDGGVLPKLYSCALGGVLGAELTYALTQNLGGSHASNSSDVIRLGTRQNLNNFFAGMMADTALWNRVLTSGELAALGRGFCPLCLPRGLVYYDEGRVTSMNRAPGGGQAGTITGTTAADHPSVLFPIRNRTVKTPSATSITVERDSAVVAGASGLAPYTGLVATRGAQCESINITNRQLMSRTGHFARTAISSLRILIPNWYTPVGSWAETGTGSTATVTASIEYPAGTFTQVLFGGSASGSVPNLTTLTSDAVSVSIPDGAKFWVRIYWVSTTGVLLNPQDVSGGATIGDGLEMGVSGITDKTMSGTVTLADMGFPPVAIIGTTQRPSVVIVGDSIAWGEYDTTGDASGDLGLVSRSIGPRYAYTNLAQRGDDTALFIASHARRAELFVYASHLICQYGFNDIYVAGRSSATVLANLASIWGYFTALSPVKRVLQTTITPKTTSTDNWATTGNQAVVTGNTTRLAINAGIRALPSGLSGVLETADVLETSRDSGIWKATGSAFGYTPDGTHPNTAGNLLVRDSGAVGTLLPHVDGSVLGQAAPVKATTGSSAGQGASAGASGKIAGVTGSSTGQGTASATSGKTAGTTGSSTGQGSSAGVSGKTAGTPGTSTGQASASGAPGATVGTTGTSAGQGSAAGQSGKTAGSTASSAGQGAAAATSGKTAGTTGSSDGTSQATGDGLDVGGTGVTGSSSGQATVTGVSSKIDGRTGSSAGAGQSQAAPASIQSQAGSSAGQGQALGQAGRIVGVSGSSSGNSMASGATDSEEAEVLVPMVARQARARKLWAHASRRQFSVMASARR